MRHKNYCKCGGPVEAAIDVIGGKWKGVALYHLSTGTKRFNELRRLMPNVTQRMLTKQLRELEKDAIVQRQVYEETPPKVEYSMTEFGKSLMPVLKELENWGDGFIARVERQKVQASKDKA